MWNLLELSDMWYLIINLGAYLIFFVLVFIMTRNVFIRKNMRLFVLFLIIVKLVSYSIKLELVSDLADVFMIGTILALIVANDQLIKKKISSTPTISKKKKNSMNTEQRNNLYRMIADAVNTLSTNKIGAIMTFERTMNLDEYIKNGVRLNAPVCPELIVTIFYEGTRLHDGAMIIRNGIIEAASVYYTPTTKALNGKYGARHRASLGISEVTDAITVVVSEETGRISFAIHGELQAVGRDMFYQSFKELMEK